MEKDETIFSSILIVARTPFKAGILKRVTGHLQIKNRRYASDTDEAALEVFKKKPDVIVMDISDYKSGEFRTKLEPFLLGIPGWIRTFLIDANTTANRIKKAAKLGVDGILGGPISHHGINTIMLNPQTLTEKPDKQKE